MGFTGRGLAGCAFSAMAVMACSLMGRGSGHDGRVGHLRMGIGWRARERECVCERVRVSAVKNAADGREPRRFAKMAAMAGA